MEDQLRKRISMMPEFIRDSISEDYTVDAIISIREKFLNDDRDKTEMLKNIIGLVIVKDLKMEQIAEALEEAFGLSKEDTNRITLIILTRIFYPISDYFPGIEDEIIKLGGEIPKTKPITFNQQLIKREEEMEAISEEEERKEEEAEKDMIVNLPIRELVKQYSKVEDQQIGTQESIMVQNSDVPMKPLVKYWIRDYLEKTGYHEHSNLDRVQYVYHDKNTKSMNEEERRQLGLVLKSLDEELPLPYSTKTGKIDFSKIVEE